ncbi:MAG: DUF3445 domain-containing protein, partial [Actinomycetota bacterium]|nr:DUF3445 domain-containing protein [Actinomycetota bacterium]
RLHEDRPVWRLNWTILDDPALHLPAPGSQERPQAAGADLGERLWFRVERQTLRRLARSGDIAFTVRTYVTNLGDLVDTDSSVAGALLASLPTVPSETVIYKGWDRMLPELLVWLRHLDDGPGR